MEEQYDSHDQSEEEDSLIDDGDEDFELFSGWSPAERAKLRRAAQQQQQQQQPSKAESGKRAWTFQDAYMDSTGTVNNMKKSTKTEKSSENKNKFSETLPVGTVLAVEFSKNRFEECRVERHTNKRTCLYFAREQNRLTHDLSIKRFFVLSGLVPNRSVTIVNSELTTVSGTSSKKKNKKKMVKGTSGTPRLYDRVSSLWGDGNVYEGEVKNILMSQAFGPLILVHYDDGDEVWSILAEEEDFTVLADESGSESESDDSLVSMEGNMGAKVGVTAQITHKKTIRRISSSTDVVQPEGTHVKHKKKVQVLNQGNGGIAASHEGTSRIKGDYDAITAYSMTVSKKRPKMDLESPVSQSTHHQNSFTDTDDRLLSTHEVGVPVKHVVKNEGTTDDAPPKKKKRKRAFFKRMRHPPNFNSVKFPPGHPKATQS
jgi:hypothetical protein